MNYLLYPIKTSSKYHSMNFQDLLPEKFLEPFDIDSIIQNLPKEDFNPEPENIEPKYKQHSPRPYFHKSIDMKSVKTPLQTRDKRHNHPVIQYHLKGMGLENEHTFRRHLEDLKYEDCIHFLRRFKNMLFVNKSKFLHYINTLDLTNQRVDQVSFDDVDEVEIDFFKHYFSLFQRNAVVKEQLQILQLESNIMLQNYIDKMDFRECVHFLLELSKMDVDTRLEYIKELADLRDFDIMEPYMPHYPRIPRRKPRKPRVNRRMFYMAQDRMRLFRALRHTFQILLQNPDIMIPEEDFKQPKKIMDIGLPNDFTIAVSCPGNSRHNDFNAEFVLKRSGKLWLDPETDYMDEKSFHTYDQIVSEILFLSGYYSKIK